MSRCLVPPSPPVTRDSRTPREPHTTRRFTAEHISCEQVSCEPVRERRGEWRVGEAWESGSMPFADSEVQSAFLRACNYIALVPQRTSSTKMANLHAKCV